MVDLMRVLGEATAATRAFVFENVAGDGAVPLSFRRAGWASDGIPYVDDPRLGHLRPAPHFPRWAELLAAGDDDQQPRARPAATESARCWS